MTHLQKNQLQFDDVYSELEYYKIQSQKQEGEISRLQTQIQKLESSNKKLQQNITLNGKNVNNTSISFFLPSEFTILWEKLIKAELLDALDASIENFVLIAHMAQDILLVTYKQTDLLIKSKIDLILKRLNIRELTQEQKDKLLLKFQSFFQENFAEIFILDKDLITKIKEELKRISNTYIFKWNKESFKEELAKQQFDKLITSVFKVCLYMLLHEPVLTLDIKEYSERKLQYFFFNKKDFINIEGFGNEKTACLIILPPPMLRKKFPYSDLKPAVYSLYDSNEEIMAECEKNQKEIQKPRSLGQTPIISKIDTSGDIYSKPTESPITPKMNAISKSISNNYGLLQNITPIVTLKDKTGLNAKIQTTTGIPIPTPNVKKENDDIKAKRNHDQPLIIKSNTITKQTPSIYSTKSFISFNNQPNHQISKEISGEITPIKHVNYNKASSITGYYKNDQFREEDKVKSINSMKNWNKTENYFKRNSVVDSNITLSPDNIRSRIELQKPSVYSIPSFNMVRNKNIYTIDNNEESLLSKTKNAIPVSKYSIYEAKHQQGFVKKQQKEDKIYKNDYYENSVLNYTNYQYENSKQKEYNESQKEYTIESKKNDNKYYKEITKSYGKPPILKQSESNLLCDQRYNINQMKLDDLKYKYQLNDSTPRGEKLAKYAIGDYYYKKKYHKN